MSMARVFCFFWPRCSWGLRCFGSHRKHGLHAANWRNSDQGLSAMETICWGFKLQGLTWSFIELTSHFVQIGLRVHRQVGETSEEHLMLMHFSMIVLSSQLVVAVAEH